LAIDVWNAMRVPSGDQTGRESGPSCVTSLRTDASDTVTIERSAEPPFASSVHAVIEGDAPAVGRPRKLPTVNDPFVGARVAFVATSMANRCVIR
jgi:hypothetical protein